MDATCPRCGKFCSRANKFCDMCGVNLEACWKKSPPLWFRVLAEAPTEMPRAKPAALGKAAAPVKETQVDPRALAGGGGFAGGALEEDAAPEEDIPLPPRKAPPSHASGSATKASAPVPPPAARAAASAPGSLDLSADLGSLDLGSLSSDGVFDLGSGDGGSPFGSPGAFPSMDAGSGFDLGGGGLSDISSFDAPDLGPVASSDRMAATPGGDGVFDLGGGLGGDGLFAGGGVGGGPGGFDLGGASLPGLDLGGGSLPGLDLGGASLPGLDLGNGSMAGLSGGLSFGADGGLEGIGGGSQSGFGGFDLGNPMDDSIPGMASGLAAPAAKRGPPAKGGGMGEFATLAFDPSASRTELPVGNPGRAAAPAPAAPQAKAAGGPKRPPQIDELVMSQPAQKMASSPEVDFSALADNAFEGFGPSSGEVDFSSLSSVGDPVAGGQNPFESMSLADFSAADLGGATGEVDFSAIADGASLEGLENSMDFSGLSSLEFIPPPEARGGGGPSKDGFDLGGGGTDIYDLDGDALASGDEELLKASLLNYKPPKR